MGGGLESPCVGRVDGANVAVRLHQVGISSYFMRKMHGQTTLKLYFFIHISFLAIKFSVRDGNIDHRRIGSTR